MRITAAAIAILAILIVTWNSRYKDGFVDGYQSRIDYERARL